jgi:hypothetical protein
MTLRLATILVLLVGAALCGSEGVVRSEELNFEIRGPAGWESVSTPGLRAHFKTEGVDVQLMVHTGDRARPLEKIAEHWRTTMEQDVSTVAERTVGRGTLGGDGCVVVDLKGRHDSSERHLTWMLGRRGARLYVLWIMRMDEAIGDAKREAAIETVRASFRFLREAEKKPPSEDEPPEELKAKTITHDYGRFECLKPEGLRRVLEIDATEAATGVVLKFDNVVEGSRCLIRVYARKGGKESIRQLAEDRIERFEKAYPPNRRKPVQKDARWKLPLARKTLVLKMTALGKSKIVHRWYFAECRNQRQYQLEIFVSGGRDWSPQVDAFLESFKPLKKKKSRR